jgi:RNAse (barnase) inhibitor barstar
MKPTFEIDGLRFHTLEEFFDEVSQILIPGADWGRNLDAFNDILRGGFGTPYGRFVLVWKNHEESGIRCQSIFPANDWRHFAWRGRIPPSDPALRVSAAGVR